jgi:outer membrane protein
MQAQAAYLQSILAREKALTDLQTSMSELMRSVQWDPRGVTPVLDEHSQIDNLQFEEEMMEEEIRRHPAVVAAQSELLESKARIQAARAELLPTLVFAGGRFLGGEPGRALALLPSQTTRLNLTLQIPIFDGFGKDYKVREAQATSASRQSDLEITVNNVANELWKSYYSLSQLLRTYPILKDVVQTKHELFLSSEKRYAAGVEDILDLLNLQKEYISAATQLTQTQLSIRIARANFLTGLGRFSLSGY